MTIRDTLVEVNRLMSSTGCCASNGRALLNQFALVSYIPSPLGSFLDDLRVQLVPTCKPRAHVSILPPRDLCGSPDEAVRELRRRVRGFEPFRVRLGRVRKFDKTNVIYLDISEGREELVAMYQAMNAGCSNSFDQYGYCPHITLAQNLIGDEVQETLDTTLEAWQKFPEDRSFLVEKLSFVQNRGPEHWLDLASVFLRASHPLNGPTQTGRAVPLHRV